MFRMNLRHVETDDATSGVDRTRKMADFVTLICSIHTPFQSYLPLQNEGDPLKLQMKKRGNSKMLLLIKNYVKMTVILIY